MQEKIHRRQNRHRLWWLMPKAFDWLSSTFYIGIFIVAFLPSPSHIAWWEAALLAGVVLTLLLIDRLEYWRYGEQVPVPAGEPPAYAFPSPARLASTSEAELRDCTMGFRAPYLLATARTIAAGHLDLERLRNMPVTGARAELLTLPGVGPKIADCVLLLAYGFQAAFPIDVWVMKALRQLYFPRRRPSPVRLQRFTETYFGCNAGYAQQYLFHYVRVKMTNEQ